MLVNARRVITQQYVRKLSRQVVYRAFPARITAIFGEPHLVGFSDCLDNEAKDRLLGRRNLYYKLSSFCFLLNRAFNEARRSRSERMVFQKRENSKAVRDVILEPVSEFRRRTAGFNELNKLLQGLFSTA